jgi:hypothetical protein
MLEIVFSPEMLAYIQKNNITELTVNDTVTQSSCCKIIVPKVILGPPKKNNKTYTHEEAYGVKLYISTKLVFHDKITFTYSRLFLREMIECQGYDIQRSPSLF